MQWRGCACASGARRLLRLPLQGPVLRRAGNRLVPRGATAWKKIRNGEAGGRWILVDARSQADPPSGRREPMVQEALRRHLQPGMAFYDIGANAGFFSLVAAKLVGTDGRIVAFEAERDVAARLREAVGRNALANVTVVVEGSAAAGCRSIPAVALDDFVRSAPPPDVIKCDVGAPKHKYFAGRRNCCRRPGRW